MSTNDAYARELELWEAYRDKDRERLEALIHPDAFDIGPAGPLERGAVLEAVAQMQIVTYAIDTFVERTFGDASIVTYRVTVDGTYAGRPFEHATVFATSVWNRRDGEWRLVHRAETPTGRD